MTQIIDAHAHIIVPEITHEFAPDEDWRPRVYRDDSNEQVVEYGGSRTKAPVREFVHIEQILEEQEIAGVERLVLCPWASLLRYDVKAEEGLRSSRIQNEALAKLSEAYPEQISALGTVPLQDPELAARELENLMQVPGLYGVIVATHMRGVYLGDDRFRPFWAAAEATGALVFIHPLSFGLSVLSLDKYYLWNTVGNPLQTTITAAQLIMSGTMETYPNLKVLLAHAGGAILSLRGRLRRSHSFQKQAMERLVEPFDDSLKRFYYDSLAHDQDLLRALIDYVGTDHVLLGSDYPFDMGSERPAEIVHALELSPDDEAKILGGNVARLLGLQD